ncbi:MAG: O-antigen ligase family protein [Pyrinomonadaceae bacterium]|nr:O-antigen ligase family protein [Sphingobacteriaceae bacterium]
MKKIGVYCLLVPFVFTTLNVQAFITKFISSSYAQSFAYLNVILVVIGTVVFFRQRQQSSTISNLWFWFFACYWVVGTIASTIHNTPSPYLAAAIPVIYLIGFSVFLSIPEHQRVFRITASVVLFIATALVIILDRFNFSMDYSGIAEYKLERAGGVYGDANQSALVGLLSFNFVYYAFKPSTPFQKGLKFLLIVISIYAIILTFSKTGFVVLLIVLGLTFNKFFTPKKLFFTLMFIFFVFTTLVNGLLDKGLSKVQSKRVEDIVNILTFNTDKVEFSNRDVLLKNMLNYVYDNPVLGNGISFSNMIRGHNTIIGVWADAGIIAFLLFLLLLFLYFKKSLNAQFEKRYFALCSIFVLAIFMLSLQSIINQPYLIAIFVYLGYFVDRYDIYPLTKN